MKTKNSSYSIPVMLMLMLAWPHVGTTVIRNWASCLGVNFLGDEGIQLGELKHPNLLDETFQPGLT